MKVYSSRKIAKIIGVSYQTICNYCNNLKLVLPLSEDELKIVIEYYKEKHNTSVK